MHSCHDMTLYYDSMIGIFLNFFFSVGKLSFHSTNSWTSSGLRENQNPMPYIYSRRFFVHAQTKVFSEHDP